MLRVACLALLLIGCGVKMEIKSGKSTRFYLEKDYYSENMSLYVLSEAATGCEWIVIRHTYGLTMDRIPQWGKKTCGGKP